LVNYTKKKSIAVIELSSSGVKTVSAAPFHVVKRTDLSKFSNYRTYVNYLHDYIGTDGCIDLVSYKANMLPQIIDRYVYLKRTLNPQAIKIIATGYYRLVKNADLVKALINKALKKAAQNSNVTVVFLSKEDESRLGFLSWLKTYRFLDTYCKDSYFAVTTTELSLINNGKSISTTSLLLEANSIFSNLPHQITGSVIDKLSLQLVGTTLKLMQNIPVGCFNVAYCVVTGHCGAVLDKSTINDCEALTIDTVLPRLEYLKDLLVNNYEFPYATNKAMALRQYITLTILHVILKTFKIESYYLNRASLRIGCFYDMRDTLIAITNSK